MSGPTGLRFVEPGLGTRAADNSSSRGAAGVALTVARNYLPSLGRFMSQDVPLVDPRDCAMM